MRTWKYLLTDPWVDVGHLLLAPSTGEPTQSPNSTEHFCTLLALYVACEDDQELIILPRYPCLVHLVGCYHELIWLFHPALQDVSWVYIVVWFGEGCIHRDHWLRQVIHRLKLLCPKGRNLCSNDTAQHHSLWRSMRDNHVDHVCAWKRGISACNPVQARLV